MGVKSNDSSNGVADTASLPLRIPWGNSEMPETIRTANERLRSRPRRGGFLTAAVLANICVMSGSQASAATETLTRAFAVFDRQQIATLALFAGLACFAALATIVLIRTRRSAEHGSRDDAITLQAEVDRFKQLLLSDPQVLVTWAAADDKPEILGDTTLIYPRHPARPGARFRRVAGTGSGATHGTSSGERCAATAVASS